MINKSTLGVVAISYNEEEDLPGFISHLLPWVDEIIIIDDGSTDRTAVIAREFAGKVNFISSPRVEGEYYAQQRNKGIDAANSTWLLHMDVDERVTPSLAREIIESIKSPVKKAFKFRRLNYFLHKPMQAGGWADWNQVHLAKKEVLRFEGMFHEDIKLEATQHEIGQLANLMHHFNDATYSERLLKSSTYQKEVAQRVINSGKKLGASAILMAFIKEFIYKYFYKNGFQDGTVGLISALHSASANFKAHALVWDEQNRLSRAGLEDQFRVMWEESELVSKKNV
jgi:glycosyltransferase involved in cell wall biosynthesis